MLAQISKVSNDGKRRLLSGFTAGVLRKANMGTMIYFWGYGGLLSMTIPHVPEPNFAKCGIDALRARLLQSS
jgi:hypothetical protein